MLAVFIILAFFVTVSFLTIGVTLRYDGQLTLLLKIGPFKLKLLPAQAEQTQKPKREKKEKAKKEKPLKPEKEKEKGEVLAVVRELLPLGLRALGRFRRSLSVDELTLHYTAASPDPCDAAMQYGRVSAGVYTAVGLLRACLVFRELDVEIDVDFDAEAPVIFACLRVSVAVWQIVYIGLSFGLEYLNVKHRNRQ